MTLVRFYVLNDDSPWARDRVACQLAARGYQQGIRTYINLPDLAACRRLDEMLWTFRDQSFIPHAVCEAESDNDCVVGLGCNLEPADNFRVLINLGNEVPHFFSRFDKTLEIIDGREETRLAGRQRWCFYKDRGYPLEKHDL